VSQDKGKKIVLVGMLDSYKGDDSPEIWGVNYTFKTQKKPPLTRLFALHRLKDHGKNMDAFIQQANKLKAPIVMRKHYDEIPLSIPFDADKLINYFDGIEYFTGTPCYMLAQAIMDGYTNIILKGMYSYRDSVEYMDVKPCMDFWCGIAIGRGCYITADKNSALCRPYPWQPKRYAYYRNKNENICASTLSASYKACCQYPRAFVKELDDIEVEMVA
jgi:hypothetical protein